MARLSTICAIFSLLAASSSRWRLLPSSFRLKGPGAKSTMEQLTSGADFLESEEQQDFDIGDYVDKITTTFSGFMKQANHVPGLNPRSVPVEVVPDRAVVETSSAEGLTSVGRNGQYQAVAGETGSYFVQARDKHGNEVTAQLVPITPATFVEDGSEGYGATIRDNADGTYNVSFVPELAGTYWVQTRFDGQRVQYSHEDNIRPRPSSGLVDYTLQDPTLTVVHGKLNTTRCSLVEVAGQTGLKENPVGAAVGFSIVSKDSFGNTRTGATATTFDGHGDGASDVFVVNLSDNGGHLTRTTSAVQIIAVVGTNSTKSSFRLEFGGAISRPISTSASSAEIQATLMSMLGDDPVNVIVSNGTSPSGDVAWRATFLSHLEEWSRRPLRAAPDEHGSSVVSVQKVASDGVYPVEYTLHHPGRYRMAVTDATGKFVGSRMVEAASVDTQASWSSVTGDGLCGGVAGHQLRVVVQAGISPPQPKVQALVAWPQDLTGNDTTGDGLAGTFGLAYGGRRAVSTPFDATAGLSGGAASVTVERSADAPLWLITFGGSNFSHIGENQRSAELCRANHEPPGGIEYSLTMKGKGLVGERSPSIDQPPTGLLLHEIHPRRPGVHQIDNRDLDTLDFSLFLQEPSGVGTFRDPSLPPTIGLYEKQGLSCVTKTTGAVTRQSGYVELEFMGKRARVDPGASASTLREILEGLATAAGSANTSVVVTFPSDQHAMCGIHGGEVHVEYSSTQAMSKIAVYGYYGVSHATLREITKGVDAVSYIDRGRYLIEYTPTISGNYSMEISIAGGKLTSEATVGGITITPAYVGTLIRTDKVGSAGVPHAFDVTAVDQDGRFIGSHTPGRIMVTVVAIPDPRADPSNVSERFVPVAQRSVRKKGGLLRVVGTFAPDVAGSYVVKAVFKADEGGMVAPSGKLDGHHQLATADSVVVSVLPGTLDPRMTTISGEGFDGCTAATQVYVRSNSASAAETVASGSGVHSAIAGEPATIYIHVRDAWLNTKYDLRGEVIRNTFSCALDGSELSGDGFTLMFQGYRTSTLALNASGVEVREALEGLPTVGSVGVDRRAVDKPACGYEYAVYFQPSEDDTLAHILNYGDLSDIVVETPLAASTNNFSSTVYSSGTESPGGTPTGDGIEPYTPFVVASPSSPEKPAGSSIRWESSIEDDGDAAATEVPPGQKGLATGIPAPLPPTELTFAPAESSTVEPGSGGVEDASSLDSASTAWSISTWTEECEDEDSPCFVMVEAGLLSKLALGYGRHLYEFILARVEDVRSLVLFFISWPGFLESGQTDLARDELPGLLLLFAVVAISLTINWLQSASGASASRVEAAGAWRRLARRQASAWRTHASCLQAWWIRQFRRGLRAVVTLQALQRGVTARLQMWFRAIVARAEPTRRLRAAATEQARLLETEGDPLDIADLEEAARAYFRSLNTRDAGRSQGDAVETLVAIMSALPEIFGETETRFIDPGYEISTGCLNEDCERNIPVLSKGVLTVVPFVLEGEYGEEEAYLEMLRRLGGQTELSYQLNNGGGFNTVLDCASQQGHQARTMKLKTCPTTLIVTIVRHIQTGINVRREVSFPLDDLRIDLTTPGGIVEGASYMAVAVIQQLGDDNRGHYITLLRQDASRQSPWWKCNDRVVSTVSWAEVTINAVAVLYRRVPSTS
eukprot:g8029.t1